MLRRFKPGTDFRWRQAPEICASAHCEHNRRFYGSRTALETLWKGSRNSLMAWESFVLTT